MSAGAHRFTRVGWSFAPATKSSVRWRPVVLRTVRRLSIPLLLLSLVACERASEAASGGKTAPARMPRSPEAPKEAAAEADYRRACSGCHGVDGRGNGARTGADFTSASGPLAQPDEVLVASVRDGKRGPIGLMPPHGQAMSDEAIRAVIAYIRGRFGPGNAPAAPALSPEALPIGEAP